jgi:hypothetical protein
MWKSNDHLVLRDIGDESVVIPTGSQVLNLNGLITLNAVARSVWLRLDGRHSVDALAEVITSEFDVSPERALADVAEFINDLRRLELVVDVAASV